MSQLDIDAVWTGLWNRYSAANDLKTALYTSATLPGFYVAEAPRDEVMPYCVAYLVSGTHEEDFTDERESLLIQFSVYAAGNKAAGQLLKKLTALFDDCLLTVSGYTPMWMTRESVVAVHDLESDVESWGYAVTYEVMIELGT